MVSTVNFLFMVKTYGLECLFAYICIIPDIKFLWTRGDSSDKLTAMRSQSIARSQCWTTVSKRTRSLSAPNVNSTSNNQLWKKAGCGIPTRVHPHLPGANKVVYWLSVSPGRWGWTQVGIPQQTFFRVDCCRYCALSDPVPFQGRIQELIMKGRRGCTRVWI